MTESWEPDDKLLINALDAMVGLVKIRLEAEKSILSPKALALEPSAFKVYAFLLISRPQKALYAPRLSEVLNIPTVRLNKILRQLQEEGFLTPESIR